MGYMKLIKLVQYGTHTPLLRDAVRADSARARVLLPSLAVLDAQRPKRRSSGVWPMDERHSMHRNQNVLGKSMRRANQAVVLLQSLDDCHARMYRQPQVDDIFSRLGCELPLNKSKANTEKMTPRLDASYVHKMQLKKTARHVGESCRHGISDYLASR